MKAKHTQGAEYRRTRAQVSQSSLSLLTSFLSLCVCVCVCVCVCIERERQRESDRERDLWSCGSLIWVTYITYCRFWRNWLKRRLLQRALRNLTLFSPGADSCPFCRRPFRDTLTFSPCHTWKTQLFSEGQRGIIFNLSAPSTSPHTVPTPAF